MLHRRNIWLWACVLSAGCVSSDATLYERTEHVRSALAEAAQTKDKERARRAFEQVLARAERREREAVLALCSGDPQRSKHAYMFQAYVWPGDDYGEIYPPKKYTGMWRMWYPNGQIKFEWHLKNGRDHGPQTAWYENGQKRYQVCIVDSKSYGTFVHWHSNGRKHIEAHYNGSNTPEGRRTFWDADGNVIRVEYYEKGQLAKTEKKTP